MDRKTEHLVSLQASQCAVEILASVDKESSMAWKAIIEKNMLALLEAIEKSKSAAI